MAMADEDRRKRVLFCIKSGINERILIEQAMNCGSLARVLAQMVRGGYIHARQTKKLTANRNYIRAYILGPDPATIRPDDKPKLNVPRIIRLTDTRHNDRGMYKPYKPGAMQSSLG